MLLLLCLLCLLVAIASVAAGLAPLFLSYDLTVLTSLGSSVILGTAILVVLPEGAESLFEVTGASSIRYAGIPVLVGYLLMFLVHLYFKAGQARSLNNDTSVDLNACGGLQSWDYVPDYVRILRMPYAVTSIGMIAHAAADGIALGAAASTGKLSTELTVFLSLVIHRAPAAFSMCTLLCAQRIPQPLIVRDMLIFSVIGPLAAVAVALAVTGASTLEWWAAECLLFSGGTFLFVAVENRTESISLQDTALSVVGLVIPILGTLLPEA